jgi:HrpA-like RNA helicase
MTSLKPKFLRPNFNKSDVSVEKLDEIESQYELHKFNANTDKAIDIQRKQLPIYKYKNHILYLLENNRVLVLIGETGCGKSTQIRRILIKS